MVEYESTLVISTTFSNDAEAIEKQYQPFHGVSNFGHSAKVLALRELFAYEYVPKSLPKRPRMSTLVPSCLPEACLGIQPLFPKDNNMRETAGLQTLADVLTRLLEVDGLSPNRRRDLASAVRRVAVVLGRFPEALPARMVELKGHLDRVHPEQLNPPISHKTWSNLRSNFTAALRAAGATEGKLRAALSPQWQALAAAMPEKRQRTGMSRFVRFLSDRGIDPADVRDDTVDAFMTHARDHTLLNERQLRDLHRRSTRLWNEVADATPDWPQQRLTMPSFKPPRQTVQLEDLPESLGAEIVAYLDWRLGKDPFNAAPRACRPITAKRIQDVLLLAISAYLKPGGKLADLQNLRDLVEPFRVKSILREYWTPGKTDGDRGVARPTAHGIMQVLYAIAANWPAIEAEESLLDDLRRIKKQLGSPPTGMTVKNRATLRQFEDPRNRWLLLSLPEKLWREAVKGKGSPERRAVKAQLAIAIEILLVAPVRSANLYPLQVGKTLLKPGGNRGDWHIVLDEDETKVAEPLEYQLPSNLTAMINQYIGTLRPVLIDGSRDEEYVFPSTSGGCKSQETLAQQITEVIKKRTGLSLTPHQFRHVAALFLLDEEPGNYTGVGHLLGHRNTKSSRMYTGLRTRPAGRHHERLITEQRERLKEDENIRRRRKRKPTTGPAKKDAKK